MPGWALHAIGFVATTLILGGAAPFLGGPPWWFIAVVAVATYAGGAVVIDRAVTRAFLRPWIDEGAVLGGAAVEVHAVERGVTAPDGMEVAGHTDRTWFRFDVTITPRADDLEHARWDPTELALLDPGCEADPRREETLGLGTTVHAVEVDDGGTFTEVTDHVIDGAGRIRFMAALPSQWRFARFRYCLETFGRVDLKPVVAAGSRVAA